jgi:hypothetical protein
MSCNNVNPITGGKASSTSSASASFDLLLVQDGY